MPIAAHLHQLFELGQSLFALGVKIDGMFDGYYLASGTDPARLVRPAAKHAQVIKLRYRLSNIITESHADLQDCHDLLKTAFTQVCRLENYRIDPIDRNLLVRLGEQFRWSGSGLMTFAWDKAQET